MLLFHKDKFIGVLKRAGAKFGAQESKFIAQNMQKNDLVTFSAFVKREERTLHMSGLSRLSKKPTKPLK